MPNKPPVTTLPRPRRSPAEAETLVAEALARAGWRILGRNVRHTGYELDLVVRKGATLVVVEVKARTRRIVAAADLAGLLPPRKLAALRRGARAAAARQPDVETVRIDLALVHPGADGRPTIAYYVAVH